MKIQKRKTCARNQVFNKTKSGIPLGLNYPDLKSVRTLKNIQQSPYYKSKSINDFFARYLKSSKCNSAKSKKSKNNFESSINFYESIESLFELKSSFNVSVVCRPLLLEEKNLSDKSLNLKEVVESVDKIKLAHDLEPNIVLPVST